MKSIYYSLIVIFVLSSTIFGQVSIPQLLNFQGILSRSDGMPVVDSTYSITFNLYTADIGGSSFWSETQSVSTFNGLYAVKLGDINTILDFPSADVWLGITIESEEEFLPRYRLTSVGFAYKSITSDNSYKLDGKLASDFSLSTHSHNLSTTKFISLPDSASLTFDSYGQIALIPMTLSNSSILHAWASGVVYSSGGGVISDHVRLLVNIYDQNGTFITGGHEGIAETGASPYTQVMDSLPPGEYLIALFGLRTISSLDAYDIYFAVRSTIGTEVALQTSSQIQTPIPKSIE